MPGLLKRYGIGLRSQYKRAEGGFKRAKLSTEAKVGSARTSLGAMALTVSDRALLRKSSKGTITAPARARQGARQSLAVLLRYGLVKQVGVFPAEYAITANGTKALATVATKTTLRGVSTQLTTTEGKALKLVKSKKLTVATTKEERTVLARLVKRGLLSVSTKGTYSMTALGRTILAE